MPGPTTAPQRGDTSLRPDDIVEVAYALISEHGLDWFSMRKLAAELDVNPMTVYLRFDSKDDLLDAVARRGLASVALPDLDPHGTWEQRALQLCVSLREHLLGDRNMLALYATANRLSGAVLYAVEHGLALVEEVGYRDEAAVMAFRSLFWHTVGFTLVDHNFEAFPADGPGGLTDTVGAIDAATHPTFARHLPSFTSVDGEELFVHTTRLIVAGLRADAPSQPTSRPLENP